MPAGSRYTPSTAPLVSGWDRWRKGLSPPPVAPLGGETPGGVKVELYISEAWVDITRLDKATPGVYYRDNIVITRGRPDESSQPNPATCRFTLNNRDGRFSSRNPLSPYYGLIGRNTPCRVSVVQANGIRRYRFYGEVSAWPQKWDITGTDVYVQIEAAGILRRLGQGSTPLQSALYRGILGSAANLVAYWPCEDGVGSTFIASAVTGISAMTINGTATLASDSASFLASSALPVVDAASFTGYIPTYDSSLGQHQVRFLLSVPSTGATNGQVACELTTTGSIVKWELYYGTGGSLGLRGFATDGTTTTDTGALAFNVNGVPCRFAIELTQQGTAVKYTVEMLPTHFGPGTFLDTTVAGQTVGQVTRVVLAPKGLTGTTVGHATLQNRVTSLFEIESQLNGFTGEGAGTRIARLCAEEGINYQRIGTASTAAMGVQSTSTLLTVIEDASSADLGVLYEPRDQVALAYRDRESLYNQVARLALDYSAGQLAASLDPVDDDQRTRNDVTVTRTNGSSVRATLTTGALSVGAVGQYSDAVSVNLSVDSQLADQAGWRLHLGTVDSARYPTLELNLAHPTFTGSETLMSSALTLDMGDRVTISNLPAWLPPDQISLLTEAIAETINGIEHTMTLTCSTEAPYRIGVYEDSTWRYSSAGSTLTSAYGATDTSLSVTTPTGPVWSNTDGNFDIIVSGERMTVTGVTGSSSPQTFTVTRAVNGIAKSQLAGATVALFNPAYYAI